MGGDSRLLKPVLGSLEGSVLPDHHPLHAVEDRGSGAHRTGAQSRYQGEIPPVATTARVSKTDHLRMGRRIPGLDSLVVSLGDDLSLFGHQDRSDRNPPFRPALLGHRDRGLDALLHQCSDHVTLPAGSFGYPPIPLCREVRRPYPLGSSCCREDIREPDMSDAETTAPEPRTWSSSRVDLSQAARLKTLVQDLSDLSRLERPEDVAPLLRRSSMMSVAVDGVIALSTRDLDPGCYRITRLAVEDLKDLARPVDTWSRREEIPIHQGGLIGDLIADQSPAIHRDLQAADDPILGSALARFESVVAIPLLDDGQARNWVLLFFERPEGMTIEQLEERTMLSNLMGGTVRLLRARQEVRQAHDEIQREVDQIAEIQRSFMPREVPSLDGWSLAGRFETSSVAGGDLWTVRTLEDGRVALLVADASGHGPAAAVMAAMTHAVFHACESTELDPAAIARRLNRYLARWQVAGAFVTAMTGLLDPRNGRLIYARCGHPPGLVRRTDSKSIGDIERLDAVGGPPLGIIEELDYETAEAGIEPGDTMTLVTDGILEARDPDGRMLGEPGLMKALLECSDGADCTLQRIESAVHRFEGDRKPEDDQTVVVIHRTSLGE